MTKILIRWLIVTLAVFLAAQIVPGITVENASGWITYAIVALVLGLVNAFVRPLLKILTCPLIILTLGLFTLVINGVTLMLASELASWLGVSFEVDGFGAAFLGALIISIVTTILSALVREDVEEE